jgi:hypothetical protein
MSIGCNNGIDIRPCAFLIFCPFLLVDIKKWWNLWSIEYCPSDWIEVFVNFISSWAQSTNDNSSENLFSGQYENWLQHLCRTLQNQPDEAPEMGTAPERDNDQISFGHFPHR